jgi:hypothetical protein
VGNDSKGSSYSSLLKLVVDIGDPLLLRLLIALLVLGLLYPTKISFLWAAGSVDDLNAFWKERMSVKSMSSS